MEEDDYDRRSDYPRSRRDEWDDRQDDGPARRRRYRDQRDDYDEEFGDRDPRQKLRGPGIALMIAGWLGILLGVGGSVAFVTLMPRMPAANQNDDVFVMVLLILSGLITAVASTVIAMGGSRMCQCRSYGLAMTAAILAISSIAILGLCSIFVLPFGVWALVVLVQPDVKREFDQVRRTDRPESEREWE